jgi:hypothetical protein
MCRAQNEMQTINSIKSDVNYLYATGTSANNATEATEIARELINLEIEQWLKEQAVEDAAGYIAKAKESLAQIDTRRGNLYRVFVYVKKGDIIPYKENEQVLVSELSQQAKTPTTPTPPTPDVATTPTTPETTPTSPATPEADPTPAPAPVQTAPTPVEAPVYTPTTHERILLSITTFNDLNAYINQGRESGFVTNVGNYKNLPQTEDCYVFIHNREGQIPALMKWSDTKAINLSTGREDQISNYKGCGAIWIQLKKE